MEFGVSVSVKEKGSYGKKNKYTLADDLEGEATLADLLLFTKTALLKISIDTLKEEQAKGFDKDPTVIVDGKFGKQLIDVNPLGKIQFVARQNLREIILETYEAIRVRTKIVTGEYGRHNVVTFNGLQVANTKQQLVAWLDKQVVFENRDKIRFINTAPYARKLEVLGISRTEGGSRRQAKYKGLKKGESITQYKRVGIPNGTYALAYKAIARKYKNNSFIAFRIVSGSEVHITGSDINEKTGKPFRRSFAKGKGAGRPYLYPSIIISAVAAGITDSRPT